MSTQTKRYTVSSSRAQALQICRSVSTDHLHDRPGNEGASTHDFIPSFAQKSNLMILSGTRYFRRLILISSYSSFWRAGSSGTTIMLPLLCAPGESMSTVSMLERTVRRRC